MTSNVNVVTGSGTFGAKQQFLVDNNPMTDHHPPGNYNPVYAQPLYESNVTIPGVTCVHGAIWNVLYIVSLNGEVYAYDADYASGNATCANGAGMSGCLWMRDETNLNNTAKEVLSTTAISKGLAMARPSSPPKGSCCLQAYYPPP